MATLEIIYLDDVLTQDKARCNSNNHWTNNEPPPNYHATIDQTHTNRWIDRIDKPYIKISIPLDACKWMISGAHLCSQIGRFSPLLEDQMQSFCQTYSSLIPEGQWFVRFENVSLKYGVHGTGPYSNLRHITESALTSIRGHTPISMLLNSASPDFTFYLINWEPLITPDLEFRVFVHQHNLVAISQQNIYAANHTITTNNWKIYLDAIVAYFETVRQAIDQPNYTYDFALLCANNSEDNSTNILVPYFIEFNSFGSEMPAGSAAFHWIIDKEILYQSDSTPCNPVFRIIHDMAANQIT